jgi:hypothetical protein
VEAIGTQRGPTNCAWYDRSGFLTSVHICNEGDAMIYELRSYEVVPGRLPALHARFKNHTLGLFEQHGIKVIGFWEAVIGTSNVLHYLLAFDDIAARDRAWSAFQADERWQKARSESEKDGPIVARIRNEIWRPTNYSPMR